MEASEDVVQGAFIGRGKPHAAGGEDRHAIGRGQIDQRLVVDFLRAIQVPGDRDIDVRAAEGADQPIEQPADAVLPRVEQRLARQRHQSLDVAVEIVQRERALPFRRAEVHPRQQTREILIARAGRDEDGKAPVTNGRLGRWRIGEGFRDFADSESSIVNLQSPIVNSTPTIALIPAACAALWKRGMP